jgi:A/G-specific adenine glycosylase
MKNMCLANRELEDPARLPRRKKSGALPHYDTAAAIVQRNGKILIAQRKHDGFLGGLWEFPGGKLEKRESLEECLEREIREELGIEIAVGELFAKVNHGYSHFRITLHAFLCTHRSGRVRKLDVADFRWIAPPELTNFAFPKADRVIIQKLLERESRS